MTRNRSPERLADILTRVLTSPSSPESSPGPSAEERGRPDPAPPDTDPTTGRYDFDLAEFPLFRLYKLAPGKSAREPLRYSDTITGRDGQPVERSWAVYPGPFGFGGQSTQVLLFDLLQLYCEQGAKGTQIQFGTLRSLFQRRGERNPSKRDYDRLRRDFDVLRGYDLHCVNAFWDSTRQSYVSMNWRLFGAVFYFRSGSSPESAEQPFGFIEVSSVLRAVARTRGFFSLGFDRRRFYGLKPLEQRLAVYLAKQFASQKLHRRFVRDLATLLPIEATRDRDVRRLLAEAATGLRVGDVGLLSDFHFSLSTNGEWLAEFTRATRLATTYTVPRRAAESLNPLVAELVARIAEAVGSDDDRVWWARCAETLGRGAVDRGLGLLKEAKATGKVTNPGGLLTKFFKDIAAEAGSSLR